jgi:hypothetical protein
MDSFPPFCLTEVEEGGVVEKEEDGEGGSGGKE